MFQTGKSGLKVSGHSHKKFFTIYALALSVRGFLNESPFKASVVFVSKARSLLLPYFSKVMRKNIWARVCLHNALFSSYLKYGPNKLK
jgi:hypothetical protein